MYASELIETLQALVKEHDDLEVTVAHGMYEYSLRGPSHAKEGPLENLGESQKQNPPARFVFEAKDDIPAS